MALWLLAGCSEEALGAARAPVVYGVDGRTEAFEHPSAVHRALAESAVAMQVHEDWIDATDPADVRITYTRTLGEAQDLCAGERFADQIEPGTCSGTLVDERHLLTAGHCVESAGDCTDYVWVLGFRYVADGVLATLTEDDVYRCSEVVAYADDGDVDHAFVRLDRPVVGHTPAAVRVEPSGLADGTEVTLIGHPNGIPVKIDSGGVVTWSSSDARSLTATVDAFHGNSGSGVFDAAGLLVALLDGGETDYVDAGGCNVVNVIDPPPADDGETLTYARPALEALCATPGLVSPLCDCDGPCVPAPAGDTCDDAEPIEPVSQVLRATLSGYTPDTTGSCGGDGPDRSYAFDLDGPTRLVARTEGFDTVLYLRAGCDGAEVACNDDVDTDTDRGSLLDEVLGPGSYVLFVDAYDARVGTYALTLTFEPVGADAGGPGPDAGVPGPTPDAGAAADAGRAGGTGSSGGGCSAAGSPAAPGGWWPLGAALALLWSQRRAR